MCYKKLYEISRDFFFDPSLIGENGLDIFIQTDIKAGQVGLLGHGLDNDGAARRDCGEPQ